MAHFPPNVFPFVSLLGNLLIHWALFGVRTNSARLFRAGGTLGGDALTDQSFPRLCQRWMLTQVQVAAHESFRKTYTVGVRGKIAPSVSRLKRCLVVMMATSTTSVNKQLFVVCVTIKERRIATRKKVPDAAPEAQNAIRHTFVCRCFR